jgi:hypothetical protein
MSDYGRVVNGRRVLDEVVRLLAQLAFDVCRGANVEGELASVFIDTRPNDDNETYRVSLTLSAHGHPLVDWAQHTVLLRSVNEDGCTWISTTNTRGQAKFSGIDPGVYSITLWLRTPSSATATEPEPELVAARGSEVRVYKNADGLVTATLTQSPNGTVSITFESEHEALDGAEIRFEYASRSRVLASGELVLARAKLTRPRTTKPLGGPVKLEAKWSGSAPAGERGELLFVVKPR